VEGAQTGLATGFNLAPVGKITAQALEVFVIDFVNAINAKLVYPAARRETILATWAAGPTGRATCSGASAATFATFTAIAITARAATEAAGTNRPVGSRGSRFGRAAISRYILIFSSHLNLSPSAFNNRKS
jgi:hypothetical protein